MRGAIDSTHAATAERLFQAILPVEDPADERIDGPVRDCVVGPQRREVVRAHVHIVRKLPAASGALKHIRILIRESAKHYRLNRRASGSEHTLPARADTRADIRVASDQPAAILSPPID